MTTPVPKPKGFDKLRKALETKTRYPTPLNMPLKPAPAQTLIGALAQTSQTKTDVDNKNQDELRMPQNVVAAATKSPEIETREELKEPEEQTSKPDSSTKKRKRDETPKPEVQKQDMDVDTVSTPVLPPTDDSKIPKESESSEPKVKKQSKKRPAKKQKLEQSKSEGKTDKSDAEDKDNKPKKKKNCDSMKSTVMSIKKQVTPSILLSAGADADIAQIVYECLLTIYTTAQETTIADERVTVTQPDICAGIKLNMSQNISHKYVPVPYLPKFCKQRKSKPPGIKTKTPKSNAVKA